MSNSSSVARLPGGPPPNELTGEQKCGLGAVREHLERAFALVTAVRDRLEGHDDKENLTAELVLLGMAEDELGNLRWLNMIGPAEVANG